MAHKFCDVIIALGETMKAAGIEVERVHITMPREQFEKFAWHVKQETRAVIPVELNEIKIRGLKIIATDDVQIINPSSWDEISTAH